MDRRINLDEKTEFCKGPFKTQVGGDHYQFGGGLPGPAEWCMRQGLGAGESAAIKYLARHKKKDGLKDIRKAYQYCEFIAWINYGIDLRAEAEKGGEPSFIGFVDRVISAKTMELNAKTAAFMGGECPDMEPGEFIQGEPQGKLFCEYVGEQKEWALKTFGPGGDVEGILKHINKEVKEIEQAPHDVEEWIDIIILAMEGAWRSGASPWQVEETLAYKLAKNRLRKWPKKEDIKPGQPIEHIKASRGGANV